MPRPAPRRFPPIRIPAPRSSSAPSSAPAASSSSGLSAPGTPPRSVVVVGAGLAATQTVAALRENGFDGRITVLGSEGVPPYDRPPLSKELLTRPAPVWLRDDLGTDIETLADEVRLAEPATGLSVCADSVHVTTTTGTVTADTVVVATGSTPVRPVGWERAWTLHTTADADRLRAALRPGLRLVIVGAGWVGAELAGVAAGHGADVTVIEAADTPLERQLGTVVGHRLAPWYSAAGVRLLTGVAVTGVDDVGVWLAATPDGDESHGPHGGGRREGPRRVEADVVVAAVGARPATSWLAGTLPLDAAGRLRVDATGRLASHDPSADPRETPGAGRVWAVGDVALREHPVFGAVPGGHWSAALHDPATTARAMLGLDPAPGHAPYVFSRQLGHDLALLGVRDPVDDVVLRGDPGHGPWAALYVDAAADLAMTPDRRVVPLRAVLLVDTPRDVGWLRRLMNVPRPLQVDLAVALDPARRLRDAIS